jgi:hypothetical protein
MQANPIETLMAEVKQAPAPMIQEVLDFVLFLKAGRYATSVNAPQEEEIEVIFDKPRTIADLANEQRAFLASISEPLIDIDPDSKV